MDEQILKEFQKVSDKIDKIDHRLFEDNGAECLQSKINRLDLWAENHEKEMRNNASFCYWLIPLLLTIIICTIDIYFKCKYK